MAQQNIFLCYITDQWLSTASKELVYIGTDVDDCIAQLAYYGMKSGSQMSEKQINSLTWCKNNNRCIQSQCSGLDYEWMIEEQRVNAFV